MECGSSGSAGTDVGSTILSSKTRTNLVLLVDNSDKVKFGSIGNGHALEFLQWRCNLDLDSLLVVIETLLSSSEFLPALGSEVGADPGGERPWQARSGV